MSLAFQCILDWGKEINTNIATSLKIFSRHPPPTDVDLSGKYYVVTGGNRGFGRGITLELVQRGANVIIGARGADASNEVIHEAMKLNPNSKVTYFHLDLASFDSINQFSRFVHESLIVEGISNGLDGLVNNAAVWMFEQEFTPSGKKNQPEMELTWAVNFFGLVYLTNSVIDLLKRSSPGARIVNVTSLMHLTVSNVDTNDPMAHMRPFEWINNYSETKLALMFYTKQLAKQLVAKGIQVFAVDPGISQTDLGTNFGPFWKWIFTTWIMKPIARNPIEGSRSIVFPLLFPNGSYNVNDWYSW